MTPSRIGIAISLFALAAVACGTSSPPNVGTGSGASTGGSGGSGTSTGSSGGSSGASSAGASGGASSGASPAAGSSSGSPGSGSPGSGNSGTSSAGASSGIGSGTGMGTGSSTGTGAGGGSSTGAAGTGASGGSGAAPPNDGGSGATSGQNGSSGSDGGSQRATPQQMVLYDDSNGRLMYFNSANPAANWISNSGAGRDLQVVGGGRVMLGKFDGWDEYRLSDGVKVGGVHGLGAVQDAYRLTDGNTMLAFVNGASIVLKMVNATGQVQSTITYPGFAYVRLVRPTSTGNYLVTADTVVFEGSPAGTVVWRVSPAGASHAWKAMRLANGNTVISTGYGASLVIYDPAGKLVQTIGGPAQPAAAQIAPWFYADFHLMPNGTYFVINSQADRTNNNSVQLLEYDTSSGALVWQQKQPTGVRTFEEGIVLDGLDTSKLCVEPQGELVAYP